MMYFLNEKIQEETDIPDYRTTSLPSFLRPPHMEQRKRLQLYEEKCLREINETESVDDGLYCPPIWDGIMCWSTEEPDTLASAPCPTYIHGFNPEAFATKRCMEDGTWFVSSDSNITWTNYTFCFFKPEENLILAHTPYIKLISQVGYSLSLSILLVAFFILAIFKKLRCPRNNLHMQLFLSFIMRAFLTLLKDILFHEGIGETDPGMQHENVESFLESSNVNVNCKIYTSFWHYFLMANYCWILMEGLYLHNLVFLSMFTDTSGICKYIVIGWGLPVVFIIPWVIVRATLEDHLCWTMNRNKDYFWIIRAPITASIIVNFIFFINITRVLFLKMFSSQVIQSRRYRYRKWFKSTLVLVPLFGAHYAILLSMSLVENQVVQTVWLYLDQSFSSFQGLFVALLYCFFNGEVQAEIRKICQRLNTKPNQPFRSQHSLFTQSLTYLSKGRSSIQSLHSTGDRRENYTTSNSVVLPASKDTHLQMMTSQLSSKSSALSLGDDAKPSSATTASATELDHRPPGISATRKNSPWTTTDKPLGNTEYENLLNEELNSRSEGSFQRESIL